MKHLPPIIPSQITKLFTMSALDKELIHYRTAKISDALCLSVLFKQVYMHNYATEGISTDFSAFIVKEFAIAKIEQKLLRHPTCMIVAEYKGNLVGVAAIEYEKKSPIGEIIAPELNKLYILEHFTRLGIGRQLLKQVEKQLIKQQYSALWLWVYGINDRAIQFYERQNYQDIGNAFFELNGTLYENRVLHKQL